jgi:subtilisin family serine protease
MKRWGLVGAMVLAACAPETPSTRGAQHQPCPGVTAGELGDTSQGLSTPRPEDGDGREAVFIHYRGDGVSASSLARQLGVEVKATYRSMPVVAARVTPAQKRALAMDPRVESIEPDSELRALGPATLPVRNLVSSTARGTVSGEYTDGLRKVQANLVWDRDGDGRPDPANGDPTLTTGTGVKVCIIDSGLDPDHPELRDAVVAAYDFLDGDGVPADKDRNGRWGSGHGTHVAGIIAARAGVGGNNGTQALNGGGLMGVAPGAELVIARVLDADGRTQMSTVLEAVEYCQQQGSKVASLSLGGGLPTRASLMAFKAAFDEGMLVVAAAGNDGTNMVSYPASDPSVLAVGALDSNDRKADFSSFGDGLALMAPGVDVLSTFPVGQGALSELKVDDTYPLSRPLLYGPVESTGGKLVDCGAGETLDSCELSDCSGFIAYVRPGRVPVERVMKNVMLQGARAVIFGNDVIDSGVEIYALPPGHWVPAVTVNQAGSTLLDRALGYVVRLQVKEADYAYMSGTSMATPYVSGVAALLFSAYPDAEVGQVRSALLTSARDLGQPEFDEQYGNGMVQALDAIQKLKSDLKR